MDEDELKNFKNNNLNQELKKIDLLKQELDVNLQQQVLLKKRIDLIKEVFLEMPNTNPEYAILLTQQELDLVELDELKYRENMISELLSKHSK